MKTLIVYFNVDAFAVQLKNHLESALDELQIEWKECFIEDVKKVSEKFQPTMHIFFHPNKRIYDFLEIIKDLKGHKLLWDMESPYESDLVFDSAPDIYYIFTSDERTANELQNQVGDQNCVRYVPHACNPKFHKPMEVPFEYRSDILFVGNAYDSRLKWLQNHAEEFKDKLVTLIGVGYRGLDGYQNQRVIHGHISEGEMIKYINGAKLVLNLHRQNEDLDMANEREIPPSSFNNRYYEVMSCGKPQLVVGRGKDGKDEWETSILRYEDLENWQKANSYKSRLVEFYLPLLKK